MLGRISFLIVIVILASGCSQLTKLITLFDEPPQFTETIGDPVRGKEIFQVGVNNNAPACSTCHLVREGGFGMSLAPNLHDIATTGNERIETLSAEAYIRNSIIHPEDFVIPGYRDHMYTDYEKDLSEQDIADLIAYLMTLS